MMTNNVSPTKSNLVFVVWFALVSGVPLINRIAKIATIIEII